MATRYAPGPRGSLLLGNIPDMQRDSLSFVMGLVRQYGDVAHFRLGPYHVHLISNPDDIHDMLVERADLFPRGRYSRELLSKSLGLGILTTDGAYHRQQRRMAQPAFHNKRVGAYAESMVDLSRRLVDGWQPNQVYDIAEEMMRLTLYIVAKTLFNTEMSGGSASIIGDAVTDVQQFTNQQFQTLLSLPEWVPTTLNRRHKHAQAAMHGEIIRMIEQHRASGEDTGDLLSMLMMTTDEETGQRMTDQQLLAESLAILAAGHETTANAMNFTWYLLAQHPEVETKFREELGRVLGGRLPTFEDIPQLAYTNMIVKESMRVYPPVWAFNREPAEDVEIGGYTIRKGEMIMVSPYALGHDPRFYDNPESFLPERWEDGLEKRLPRYVYIPFASGPHVCIGQQFATMEATLLLATIAQRYRLEPVSGYKLALDALITLRPRGGMPMRVVPC